MSELERNKQASISQARVIIDLGTLLRPGVLASSLVAYVPVFGPVQVWDADYARLLYALGGVAEEDPSSTEWDPSRGISRWKDELAADISAATDLLNPFASARLVEAALREGYLELLRGTAWMEGYLSLFPEDVQHLLLQRELRGSTIPRNFEQLHDTYFYGFAQRMQPSLNQEVATFEAAVHHSTCRLATNLFDSRLGALGLGATEDFLVSTPSPRFWKTLQRRLHPQKSVPVRSDAAAIVERLPERFSVDDVLRFVEVAPALERLLIVKEQFEPRIETPRQLARESVVLVLKEVAGALAAPFVIGFEVLRMLFRIDFNKWHRRP